MKPDAALQLVEAYLGVNGYFVLTELEVHVKEKGTFRTLTDVDVVAVRHPTFPGPAHYRGTDGAVECLLTDEVDPALEVAADRCHVIVGEVKRGEASFNPMLRDPRVLHAVLRRIGDVVGSPAEEVIDGLTATGEVSTPSARLRLVAFGSHGSVRDGLVIRHDHMVEWLNAVLASHRDLFEITAFSDPVLNLISLAARVDRPLAAHSVAETADGDRSPDRAAKAPRAVGGGQP